MGNFATARAAMVSIVGEITVAAGDEPAITFREAPKGIGLESLTLALSPAENTRKYHVIGLPDVDFSEWNGHLVVVEQAIQVKVLYHIPMGQGTEGWTRLHTLAATDSGVITTNLNKPPAAGTQWSGATRNIVPRDQQLAKRSDDEPDVWILTLTFDLQYALVN